MSDKISVVLLQDEFAGPARALQRELHAQSVVVRRATSCREIPELLGGPTAPELILTDLRLSDGTWEDVVRLAENASSPVNVIVVSRLVDVRLYAETLEKGAFDFITPPFEPRDIAHVLRSAAVNVAARRETLARATLRYPARPRRAGLAVAS